MSQTVALPDGTQLEFPDGMSQGDMASAIYSNFPKFKPQGQAPADAPQGDPSGAGDFASIASQPTAAPPDAGGGRGFVNPPAASQPQPKPVTDRSRFVQTDMPVTDAMGNATGQTQSIDATEDPDEVGAFASTVRGAGRSAVELPKAAALLAGTPVVAAEAIANAITGSKRSDWQDWYFSKFVQPLQDAQDWYAIKPEEKQSTLAKIGGGIGALASDLPLMISSGGLSVESKGAQAAPEMMPFIEQAASRGFEAMRAIMVKSGTEKAKEVLDAGGTPTQAANSALTAAITTGFQGMLPMSVEGGAATRVATGAPVGVVQGEASRVIQNAADPQGMQRDFDPENAVVEGVTGAAMAGAMGHGGAHTAPDRIDLGYDPATGKTATAQAVRDAYPTEQPRPIEPTQASRPDPIARVLNAPSLDEAIHAAEAAAQPGTDIRDQMLAVRPTLEQELADLRRTTGSADVSADDGVRPDAAGADSGRLDQPGAGLDAGVGRADEPVRATGSGDLDTAAGGPVAHGAADAVGELSAVMNPSGTLTVAGADPKGVLKLLKDAGITSAIPSRDGVVVGRSQAEDAQRVVADFQHPEATESGPAAEAAAAPELAANPFKTFLIRNGIALRLAKDFTPGTKERLAMGRTFRKDGMELDDLAERAAEAGFIKSRDDTDTLYDLVRRVASGERVAPMFGQDADAELAARMGRQRQFEEDTAREEAIRRTGQDQTHDFALTPEELHESGYTQDTSDVQARVRELVAQAEAHGLDADSILEDAAKVTQNGTDHDFLQAARTAVESAIARRREAGARDRGEDPGQEGAAPARGEEARAPGTDANDVGHAAQANDSRASRPASAVRERPDDQSRVDAGDEARMGHRPAAGELTSPSREDVVRQQERRQQGERAEQQRKADEESRARADADLPDFGLTGSDRAADANPQQMALGAEAPHDPIERVLERTAPEHIAALEEHYGVGARSREFASRLAADVSTYVNKGAAYISAKIRAAVKAVAEGVLAVSIVFNPMGLRSDFAVNPTEMRARTVQTILEVRTPVPASARAEMSPLARDVYESMAATAKESGKGFIIADKPNAMIHVFDAQGRPIAQAPALYGKDRGDSEAGNSLTGAARVTPAGKYTLKAVDNPEYDTGHILQLRETYREGEGVVAVHSVWLGDPAEGRAARLESPNPDDRRISFGCINTASDTFKNAILPNIEKLNGGMIFVLPDDTARTREMFPATKVSESRTVFDGDQSASGTGDNREPMAPRQERARVDRQSSGRRREDDANPSLDGVRKAWDAAGIKHAITEKDGTIEVSQIVVPKEARDQGVGTEAMRQLAEYADVTGQRITLTPSADFGGSKSRLTEFYKRFGFEENKGRSRDFTTRDTMIREPQAPSFKRSDAEPKVGKSSQIQEAVSTLTRDWLRKPDIHVLRDMSEAPEPVRRVWEQQDSKGAQGSIEGFHWRGGVYLVADALATKGDVQRVLYHEALGHFGLRGLMGDRLDGVLREVSAAMPKEIALKAKQYGLDVNTPRERMIAAEEVLAELAQTRPEMGVVKRAVAAIRQWLREHGIDSLKLTRDDIIANYILPARGWVERAKDTEPSFAKGETQFSRASEADLPDEVKDQPEGYTGPGAKMIDGANGLMNHVYMALAPMSAGDAKSQASAQQFVNDTRVARFQWQKMSTLLKAAFPKAEREQMWNAADQENDLRREAAANPDFQRPAGQGLDSVTPKQRVAMQTLHEYGDALWQRAKAAGLVEGEGVPFWTPRTAVMIGEDGNYSKVPDPGKKAMADGTGRNVFTTAPSAKHRKYDTTTESEAALKAKLGDNATYVRDILTMPLAMSRFEQAIAGRELINTVKDIGIASGKELVNTTGGPGFFTLDHPAFSTFRPRMAEGGDGKLSALKDESGKVVLERAPLFIDKSWEGPLKAVMSTKDNAIYTGYMLLKSKAMTAIMYSPLIHNQVIFGRALGYTNLTEGGLFKTIGLYFTGHFAKQDNAFMRQMIGAGMVPIGEHNNMLDATDVAADRVKEGGWLDPNESWIALGAKAAGNAVRKGAGDAIKGGLDAAGDVWHNTLLWRRVGDLQAGIARDAYDKLVSRGINPDVAAVAAAHLANRYAGAVGQENMSKFTHMALNVELFSKSFNVANVGTVKDAFAGTTAGLKALIRERADSPQEALKVESFLKNKARFGLARDLAYSIIAMNLASLWFQRDKDADWSMGSVRKGLNRETELAMKAYLNWKEHPTTLDSYDPRRFSGAYDNEPGKEGRVFMGLQESGRGQYMRLPMGKVIEDLIGWTTNFPKTLDAKKSPFMHALDVFRKKKDDYGTPIWDNRDPNFAHKLSDAAMFLLGTHFPVDQVKTVKDLAAGVATPLDKEKTAGNFTGLTISQGHPSGPQAAVADEVDKSVKGSQQHAMDEVKRLLKYGKSDEAWELLQQSDLTPREISHIMQRVNDPKAVISRSALRKFNAHATEAERARFDEVNQ